MQGYDVKIQRQNRRNLLMQVAAGGVVVFIPRWMQPDSPQVEQFIRDGLKKLASHIPPAREATLTETQIRAMVAAWAERMELQPERVTLRPMRRKWGSCSNRGNVTLNKALLTVPPELAEYVVVHELAHLRVFDHSPRFWALVAEYLPDYEQRRTALDTILI